MAGAEAAVQRVICERPKVSQRLIKGSKFLKWPKSDGDDSSFVPVTLRVDPNGYILYWQEPSKDAECVDIATIRDTRTGHYAKTPKQEKTQRALQNFLDPHQYKSLTQSGIQLHEICFTVVCGCNLVNITYYNFIAVESNPTVVLSEWADFLLKLAYHPTTRHISIQTGYEKAYCKLKHDTDQLGKIPVSKVTKMFPIKSKLVENALLTIGIINSKKDSTIDPDNFKFAQFRKLLQLCCPRNELDDVFLQVFKERKMYVNYEKMKDFVNEKQRDPSINQLLYPKMTDEQAQELVQQNEPNVMFANKGRLTMDGFDSYLQSDDNLVVGIEAFTLDDDLNQPLSHYFVNSSHNTYLTGGQLRSKSSTEMYRQVLLTGCRCVELDIWDREEEPAITHGFTFCTDVLFRDVIEAINESAFKTSSLPVVLSFENHVDVPEQQAKMAKYCREIFGEKLLIDPLDEYPLIAGKPLPSPKELQYKIIIKNKKQRIPPQKERRKQSTQDNNGSKRKSFYGESEADKKSLLSREGSRKQNVDSSQKKKCKDTKADASVTCLPGDTSISNEDADSNSSKTLDTIKDTQSNSMKKDNLNSEKDEPNKNTTNQKNSTIEASLNTDEKVKVSRTTSNATEKGEGDMFDEEEEEDEEGELTTADYEVHAKDSGTASKESKASEFMSQLVNYIQPVRFKSFEVSQRRNHSYEISSFTETSALKLLADDPVGFVKYNQRQMSRIYPKGARVESSNYMPQGFWNAGSQFVALNFQVLDLPMQLNMAKFELNGGCGYLTKPSLMRYKDKHFDPFAEKIDGVVAKQLQIKIISGQFLSSSKLSTYVEVDMFGIPVDTYRKKFRTKIVESNSLNPFYNSPMYLFKKIILPDLAMLRIAVMDSSGNLVGQRFFPFLYIKPGYRYITLHNEGNQSMTMQSVFVYIEVGDYVSAPDLKMINDLCNPIQAVAEKERQEQLKQDRLKALKKLMTQEEKEEEGLIEEPKPDGDSPERHILDRKPSPKTIPFQSNDKNIINDNTSSTQNENNKPGDKVIKKPVTKYLAKPVDKKQKKKENDLEEYHPNTLNDIKLGKEYNNLMNKQDRSKKNYKDKQKEAFAKYYFTIYPGDRPKSAFSKLFGKKKTISEDTEFCTSEKQNNLEAFVRNQLIEDKEWQIKQVDTMINKFEQIVIDHQKWEIENLNKICKKEKDDVTNRKDREKCNLLSNIPVNLDKQEIQRQRNEITENHIDSSVKELMKLTLKQQARKTQVEDKQKEIKNTLENESEARINQIKSQYEEDLKRLTSVVESKVNELRVKKGISTTGNCSNVDTQSTKSILYS